MDSANDDDDRWWWGNILQREKCSGWVFDSYYRSKSQDGLVQFVGVEGLLVRVDGVLGVRETVALLAVDWGRRMRRGRRRPGYGRGRLEGGALGTGRLHLFPYLLHDLLAETALVDLQNSKKTVLSNQRKKGVVHY